MSTRIWLLLLALLSGVLFAGCSSEKSTAEPTPAAGALAVAKSSGPTTTSVLLAQPIEDYRFNVTCTGSGTMEYKAMAPKSDFSGTIACPGTLNGLGVSAFARETVTLKLVPSSDQVKGILQLAPVES